MKFNSQICTTREQSERLIALGLKKETADCCYYYYDGEYLIAFAEDAKYPSDIPAWSMSRLIELLPYSVERHNKNWTLEVSKGYVRYGMVGTEKVYVGFIQKPNTYDAIIDCIEWLIQDGDFEEEYLV